MPARAYTKADLEELVLCQLQNLNAMNDLISIMRFQNELLENANKRLKSEISTFKEHQVRNPMRRKPTSK